MLREFISSRREFYDDLLDDVLDALGCIVLVAIVVIAGDEIAAQERRRMMHVVRDA
jgi:2-phospho-L-lactate guanylyltransferase (CobY/MobA/RfbA family)